MEEYQVSRHSSPVLLGMPSSETSGALKQLPYTSQRLPIVSEVPVPTQNPRPRQDPEHAKVSTPIAESHTDLPCRRGVDQGRTIKFLQVGLQVFDQGAI